MSSPRRTVYIIGAGGTGKTTLVQALKASFKADDIDVSITHEVARTVLAGYGSHINEILQDKDRNLALQQDIMRAQYEAEKILGTELGSWYIADRSGIDPICYTKLYIGEEAAKTLLASSTWMNLENLMRRGLVFLCEAGNDWLVDDGVRLMPNMEEWLQLDLCFRTILEQRQIEYRVLSKDMKDLRERVEFVRHHLGACGAPKHTATIEPKPADHSLGSACQCKS